MLAISCGESSPPKIMIFGVSFSALPTMTTASALNPTIIRGNRKRGTSTVEISVRRSHPFREFLAVDNSNCVQVHSVLCLSPGLQRAHNLDENFLQVLFCVPLTQLRKRPLGQQLPVMNDPDHVAELFDFAHDVRRENHGFAAVAALAN